MRKEIRKEKLIRHKVCASKKESMCFTLTCLRSLSLLRFEKSRKKMVFLVHCEAFAFHPPGLSSFYGYYFRFIGAIHIFTLCMFSSAQDIVHTNKVSFKIFFYTSSRATKNIRRNTQMHCLNTQMFLLRNGLHWIFFSHIWSNIQNIWHLNRPKRFLPLSFSLSLHFTSGSVSLTRALSLTMVVVAW